MEYSGKIDFWGFPGDAWMDFEDIKELVERYVADNEKEDIEEEITICGHARKEINKDRLADWVIDELLEHMDDEYTIENGNTQPVTPAIREAALNLVEAIIENGYNVEVLDKVCEKKIKISDYIEKEKRDGI